MSGTKKIINKGNGRAIALDQMSVTNAARTLNSKTVTFSATSAATRLSNATNSVNQSTQNPKATSTTPAAISSSKKK